MKEKYFDTKILLDFTNILAQGKKIFAGQVLVSVNVIIILTYVQYLYARVFGYKAEQGSTSYKCNRNNSLSRSAMKLIQYYKIYSITGLGNS